MIQIVDIFRMLFEFYTYEQKGVKRSYVNIAGDLLHGFTVKSIFLDSDEAKLEIVGKLILV